MPSSLIFAALAVAWLVVLVPMIAKRRQEVVRTAESALASRVLPRSSSSRPGPSRPVPPRAAPQHGQEMPMVSGRIAQREPAAEERRYRSGRGGYDPELAAQLARQKYVFRQRVVLGLAVGALVTLVLAYAVSGLLWWVHAALDVSIAAYLGYLRRQVRIEDEVRQRRAARLAGPRTSESHAAVPAEDVVHDAEELLQEPAVRPAVPSVPHPTAVALDLDDEDPMFDELRPVFQPRYRRAVGE
ncbi:MAG: divisome protein SepX/GlpR [Pseudonocardiaceae bacterium]